MALELLKETGEGGCSLGRRVGEGFLGREHCVHFRRV